jgi:hypothetical protein
MTAPEDLLDIPKFLLRKPGEETKWDVPLEDLKPYAELIAEEEAAKAISLKQSSIKDIPKEAPKQAAPKISIQQRMKNQIGEYIADLEDVLDAFVTNGYKTDFEIYKWLNAENVKSPQAAAISEYYRPQLEELEEVKCKTDQQLLEGYSHLKSGELNLFIAFLKTLVDDSMRWSANSKKAKGSRKPKKRSVESVLKHMKFKATDNTFKVASVDPELIIGAKELWVLHTGFVKKIGVYRALDRGGLSVNRSSIRNFDPANSVEKRIGSKPDVTIEKVLKGGKVTLRKLTGTLRAKDEEPSGKINKNVILLRVIK